MRTKNFPELIKAFLPNRSFPELRRVLGREPSSSDWLLLSHVHRSFASAIPDQDLRNYLTDTISVFDAVGSAVAQLALHDYAYSSLQMTDRLQVARLVASTAPSLIDTLSTILDLDHQLIAGKSLRPDNKPEWASSRRSIALQILGALYLSDGYPTINVVLSPILSTLRNSTLLLTSLDSKSLLQEHAHRVRWGTPRYELIADLGPQHSKTYRLRVLLDCGFTAEGSGPSKKYAERHAAFCLLQQHAPHVIITAGRAEHNNNTSPLPLASLSLRQRQELERVGTYFAIPRASFPILVQALTHRSYQDRQLRLKNYGQYSQLGAAVFGLGVRELLARKLLSTAIRVASDHALLVKIGAILLAEDFVAQLARRVHLEDAVLRGRGQPLIASISADAFQALIGVSFRVNTGHRHALQLFPSDLRNYLSHIVDVHINDPLTIRDPKSQLQELLQALGLTISYSNSQEGPGHAPTFHILGVLGDRHEHLRLRLGTGVGKSRREAEGHLASNLLQFIRELHGNGRIGASTLQALFMRNPKVARIVLRAGLTEAPKTMADARSFIKLGLSGSKALVDGRLSDFCVWLSAVAGFLASSPESNPLSLDLSPLLSACKEKRTHPLQLYSQATLTKVAKGVRALEPELDETDFRRTENYQCVLKLLTLFRLLSEPCTCCNIRDVIQNVASVFLAKVDVRFEDGGERVGETFYARGGTISAFIDEVVNLVRAWESVESLQVTLTAQQHCGFRYLVISVPTSNSHRLVEIITSQQQDMLWQVYAVDLSIVNISTTDSGFEVWCGPHPEEGDTSIWAAHLRRYYETCYCYEQDEIEIASRLLHDLKNILTAYSLCVIQKPENRTEALRLKLTASRHKDSAEAIVASLETLTSVALSLTVTSIKPSSFLRALITDLLPTVPVGVRLLLPKGIDETPFLTSEALLRAALINLIRNSVEALPNGGDVLSDFCRVDGKLIIEVADNGPGITPDRLERILSALPVESTKRGGSGLGMLTTVRMLRRIGGQLDGRSRPGAGMVWTISLTEMECTEEVGAISEYEDLMG